MGLKCFEIPLECGHYIAIELSIFRGQVTSFVVRFMARFESGDICIARYDTAHGRPHRDILSPVGRIRKKDWLLDMTFADAANYAIRDFKDHHEAYLQQFISSQGANP